MSPNGAISTTVNEKATTAYSYAQHSLNRVVSPESRQRTYDQIVTFAADRPIFFSFITSHLLLSFLPILTFTIFSLSTVVFALCAAIIFSLFWIGVALLVLIPTVLVTGSVAVFVWGWAVGSFLIARWLYHRVQGVEMEQERQQKKTAVVIKREDASGVDGIEGRD